MSDDKPFIHLHVHTEYSLLDGLSRISKLVKRAHDLNMHSLAITDHGAMFGVIDFYNACKKVGIKPIIGMEAYLARRTMQDRDSKLDSRPFHLLLLAKNETGYKNLLKIASAAQLEGYYYRPRIDRDFLASHAEGLVATSGCLAAQIPSMIMDGRDDEAKELIGWYQDVFGADSFFLELQQHDIPELVTLNRWLYDYVQSGHTKVELVATNDVHYVRKEDYDAHDTLLCIQTSTLKTDSNRLRMSDPSYHLTDQDEMWGFFHEVPDALHNTVKIAEMCELDLERKGYHLPNFPVPGDHTADTYLRLLAEKGLDWRYASGAQVPELRERLDYELNVIHTMGFDTYFLIVWDLCEYARHADIWWNVRGSGAGSVVAYCLGITNIDPIQNNLLFERFLNPGRVSMPDIDIDYPDDRRSEMIAYTARKYGEEKVAAIITFGTLGAKAAVRDVGRALGVPLELVNQAARLIPTEPKPKPVKEYVELNPDLQHLYNADEDIRRVIDTAEHLQGVSRHVSTHAAGIIVGDKPLVEYIPLHRQTKGENDEANPLKLVTQFPMETCESIGLLKVDFLGLSTLTILRRACDLIERHQGIKYNMSNIPYRPADNEEHNRMLDETFELIGRGDTVGVFQVENSGMQQMLRGMRPKKFEHIVAAISLYRPGPMDYIPMYNNRMHGIEPVIYHHPKMQPIIEETYGILVYQEQLMQVASSLFGYSLGDADLMRRAVSKKKKEDLLKHKEIFLQRGPELDPTMSLEIAEKIFDEIEFFANYGFNKCLVASTEIIDAETGHVVTIGDLASGKASLSQTVTCDTDALRLSDARVTAVMSNGVKPVYRLTTRTGRTITATDNHPFFTFGGWRNLGNLKQGDLIATPRRLPVEGKNRWPEHRLITLGHLLAEGNLCHTTGVYYYTGSDEQLQDYIKHMEMFENSVATVTLHKSAYSVYSKRIKRSEPQALVEWIKTLGLWGKNAGEKFIPTEVFGLTNDNIALLLGRMWEGDGHVNAKHASLHYTTVSETIARQFQHLLLRFGVVSRLYKKDYKYQGDAYPGYEIHILGREMIQSFAEYIGHHFVPNSPKRVALDYLLESIPSQNGVRDIVPFAVKYLVDEHRNAKQLTWKELATKAGVAERLFSQTAEGVKKNGYTRETVGRLAAALEAQPLRSYAESDIYWDEIASIESAGEEETFDLTVENTHNFIANDILVHNSHAADYGVITVQTAFLKTHYPAEYMTALLSVYFDDAPKVTTFLAECKRLNIPILPPDVNYSMLDFDIQQQEDGRRGIRFGMAAVKNAGVAALQHIITARETGGIFRDVLDFCTRIDLRAVGKRTVESLIMVGGLTAFGTRPQLLSALDRMMSFSADHHKAKDVGQISLFGGDSGFIEDDMLKNLPPHEEATQREMLNWERELLGLYVTSHPIDPVLEMLKYIEVDYTYKLKESMPEDQDRGIKLVALVAGVRKIPTKNHEMMAVVQLEDRYGTIDAVLFPRMWRQYESMVEEGKVLLFMGKLDVSRGDAQMICESVSSNFDALTSSDMFVPPSGRDEMPSWMEDGPPTESVSVVPVAAHSSNTNGHSSGYTNGHSNGNANGRPQGKPAPTTIEYPAELTSSDEIPPWALDEEPLENGSFDGDGEAPPTVPQRITVYFERSGDNERDSRRLRKIHSILASYPGNDRFTIVSGGYELDFPNDTTQICDPLLAEINGIENTRVSVKPMS